MPLILKRAHLGGILGKARSGPQRSPPPAESLLRTMTKRPPAGSLCLLLPSDNRPD